MKRSAKPSDSSPNLADEAFARGQAALAAGDRAEAIRWLDRARRLAPGEGELALSLASALVGADNARAAALFTAVLARDDVRDAWLGLATAHLLMGETEAARVALAAALGRHAMHPDIGALAARVAGAPGWCGVTGGGMLTVRPFPPLVPIEVRLDDQVLADRLLPPDRARAAWLTVASEGRHLLGSPLHLAAISRIDGYVEATEEGVRGWAWHPGDPETDPTLSIGAGRIWRPVVASETVARPPNPPSRGLPPLARPRGFTVPWSDLPAGAVRVRGRDGRDLPVAP